MKFGKIYGRFFLKQDLGIEDDDTPHTVTISELMETFTLWPSWIQGFPGKSVKLFTMFETSDVHPDIIKNMKLFDKVIVPFDYLKDILVGHGVHCEALNWWTSPLIRTCPKVIKKKSNHEKIIFLYVGTNDIRKNLVKLVDTFINCIDGTGHKLIVKTNTTDGLPQCENIKYITHRLNYHEMAGLYNICDYVVSFSHGEGVGLPMLEAKYFGKPVISHDQGVLGTIKNDSWVVLPSKEIPIDHASVPPFLDKVFHGAWWEIDEKETFTIIKNLIK